MDNTQTKYIVIYCNRNKCTTKPLNIWHFNVRNSFIKGFSFYFLYALAILFCTAILDPLNRLIEKRDPYTTVQKLVYNKNNLQYQSIDAMGNITTLY